MKLFKILLALFFVLLLSIPCYASIYLLEPVDQQVTIGEEIFLGKVARGETVQIIVKKKSDHAVEWDTLSAGPGLLPSGWKAESVETDKTVIAMIHLPRDAASSTQRIKLTASNSGQPLFGETFYATLSVSESLLSVSFQALEQQTFAGTEGHFKMIANNDSIASHTINVESSLPRYAFAPTTLTLGPHKSIEADLAVMPYSYGEKAFSFTVSSAQNDSSFFFPAKLNAKPTLLSMYRAPVAGFPFFSPGLLPYYLLNGLLSLFS